MHELGGDRLLMRGRPICCLMLRHPSTVICLLRSRRRGCRSSACRSNDYSVIHLHGWTYGRERSQYPGVPDPL